jgi:O-antigen/teichoic acid export membrane protein
MTPELRKETLIGRRVMVGTASNFAGQVVALGTLFFLTPFILHRLGSTAYGLWVLIGSVVAYGSVLDFGIWGAIIKYVAEYRARGENDTAQALVATAFRIYAGLGLAVTLLCVIAAAIVPHWLNIPADQRGLAGQLILLMGIGAGISLPGLMPLSILRGLQRYDIVNFVEISASLFTTAATIGLLLLNGGVRGVVIANLAGLFVMLLLSAWFVRRIAPELQFARRGAKHEHVRPILRYSWPLFVKDVASRLQTKTDEITIAAFLPVAAIAPYSIARRLSEATYLLTKQFMKVLLPLASELHAENDFVRLRLIFTAGTRLTLALSLAIGGMLIILARPILTLWVGPAYAFASPLVAILATASFLAAAQWPAGAVLQGMARHRLLAATSLGSGLVNLAVSIALVRPLGLTGVALGTLIPNTIEFAIIIPYAMRAIGVSPAKFFKEVLLPILGPLLLMVSVLYGLRQVAELASLWSILLVGAVGFIFFGLGYLAMGASRAERQTYSTLAFSMFHSAKMYLRRSGG